MTSSTSVQWTEVPPIINSGTTKAPWSWYIQKQYRSGNMIVYYTML